MSEIKIEEIARIKLESDEKLLVRLPEDAGHEQFESVRESLLKFFQLTPDRILLYSGDVEFKKVKP